MVEQATHKFLTYLLTELATQDLIKCCLSKDNQSHHCLFQKKVCFIAEIPFLLNM